MDREMTSLEQEHDALWRDNRELRADIAVLKAANMALRETLTQIDRTAASNEGTPEVRLLACQVMARCSKIVSVGRVKWIPDSPFTGKDNCCWYLFEDASGAPAQFIGRAAG